ncbi:MAG TPA: hypothetical protein VL742_12605 [Casimicrobiaceae bacterium]|nr:hypothetical protein [Casimicrobiaceae bacterium]
MPEAADHSAPARRARADQIATLLGQWGRTTSSLEVLRLCGVDFMLKPVLRGAEGDCRATVQRPRISAARRSGRASRPARRGSYEYACRNIKMERFAYFSRIAGLVYAI